MNETLEPRGAARRHNTAGRSCVMTVDGQSYELATKAGQNAYLRGLTLRLTRLPGLPVEVSGRQREARAMAAKQLESMREKIHKLEATLEMREISADAFQFDVSQLEQAFSEVSRYAKGK